MSNEELLSDAKRRLIDLSYVYGERYDIRDEVGEKSSFINMIYEDILGGDHYTYGFNCLRGAFFESCFLEFKVILDEEYL